MQNSHQVITNINALLSQSDRIAVLISSPIDTDCLGTGLAFEWYLRQLGKQADLLSCFPLNSSLESLPQHAGIQVIDAATYDFAQYDAIVTLDGSGWDRFFGKDYANVIAGIAKSKLINIDHHEPDQIAQEIPQTALVEVAACTAQVVYYHFMAQLPRPLPAFVVEWLYKALVSDSNSFKLYSANEFKFAEDLIAEGADHYKFTDIRISLPQYQFIGWGMTNLQYFPELKLTLLTLDRAKITELRQQLGNDWNEVDYYFKATCANVAEGYDYLVVLKELPEGSVDLRWRTRNYGETLDVVELARKAGFSAGGHRNAGGGVFTGDLATAQAALLGEFKSATIQ